MSHNRFFALNFDEITIKEISFDKSYGHNFFDWGLNYAIMNDENTKRYKESRGKDGCGLFKYFNKRNDLQKMNQEIYEKQELIIKKNKGILK